jgi:hypothetical protein
VETGIPHSKTSEFPGILIWIRAALDAFVDEVVLREMVVEVA